MQTFTVLTEYVRISLRRHLCFRFGKGNDWLPALRIGEGVENLVRESIRQTSAGTYSSLDPPQSRLILAKIKTAIEEHHGAVLLTSVDVRCFLRKIVEHEMFAQPVLSWQELGDEINIKVVGTVELIGEELDGVT